MSINKLPVSVQWITVQLTDGRKSVINLNNVTCITQDKNPEKLLIFFIEEEDYIDVKYCDNEFLTSLFYTLTPANTNQ
jgi:aspartate carbamoyltransferase regulatory subunit